MPAEGNACSTTVQASYPPDNHDYHRREEHRKPEHRKAHQRYCSTLRHHHPLPILDELRPTKRTMHPIHYSAFTVLRHRRRESRGPIVIDTTVQCNSCILRYRRVRESALHDRKQYGTVLCTTTLSFAWHGFSGMLVNRTLRIKSQRAEKANGMGGSTEQYSVTDAVGSTVHFRSLHRGVALQARF